MVKAKRCKECVAQGITTNRAASYPGPRCATHWEAVKKARRVASHEAGVVRTYGLEPGEYDALCEFQGGLCAICRRAKCRGSSGKHLAVDHNHITSEPRGLCCVTCNKVLLGQYDIAALQRAIAYLTDPPYARMRNARMAAP